MLALIVQYIIRIQIYTPHSPERLLQSNRITPPQLALQQNSIPTAPIFRSRGGLVVYQGAGRGFRMTLAGNPQNLLTPLKYILLQILSTISLILSLLLLGKFEMEIHLSSLIVILDQPVMIRSRWIMWNKNIYSVYFLNPCLAAEIDIKLRQIRHSNEAEVFKLCKGDIEWTWIWHWVYKTTSPIWVITCIYFLRYLKQLRDIRDRIHRSTTFVAMHCTAQFHIKRCGDTDLFFNAGSFNCLTTESENVQQRLMHVSSCSYFLESDYLR